MAMNFSYLFRFRDLVAKTIQAHGEIIESKQAVWWGWWMRPAEGPRFEVWDALDEAVKAAGSVTVGLFDSGKGFIYQATVSAVVRPELDDDNDCKPVPVPRGEEELIPGYYRSSPFSRAWLRITKIKQVSEGDFFKTTSFDGKPALPLVDAMLNEFDGKRIIDAKELRWMDTTIWKVREAKAGDKDKEIMAAAAPPLRPIMAGPILARGDCILHISDPHYACGAHRAQHKWRLESEPLNGRASLVEAVQNALRGSDHKIGALLITGDVTFLGSTEEFGEALSGFQRFFGGLNLEKEHVVIIPGNHDIRWTKAATYQEGDKVDVAPELAMKNYRQFYGDLLKHEPDQRLSMARRFVFPSGSVVEFCGLNSSTLETGKHFLAGAGRIDDQAIQDVANGLSWSAASLALRIATQHHHFTQVYDIETADGYYKGFGMALDGPKTQRALVKNGVQLAIHGHQHQPFVWRSAVYELPEQPMRSTRTRMLSILGGGSAGSTEVRMGNYFNVIKLEPERLVVNSYYAAKDSQSFLASRAVSAKIGFDDGHLSLGDWEDA